MRVVCPSCDAAYDVPDSVVAARRRMRCARCQTLFTATDADNPEPVPPAVPPALPPARKPPIAWLDPAMEEAAPVDAPPPVTPADLSIDQTERLVPLEGEEPAGRWRVASVLAGWIVSAAVLAACCWAAITWRDRIMHAWPASTRIYAALGYTLPDAGR